MASAPLIFQSNVKAFVAPLHTLGVILPRRLASPQHLQGHSEITDNFTHQECQIGQIDYERRKDPTRIFNFRVYFRRVFQFDLFVRRGIWSFFWPTFLGATKVGVGLIFVGGVHQQRFPSLVHLYAL
jgi:hypothetical protein